MKRFVQAGSIIAAFVLVSATTQAQETTTDSTRRDSRVLSDTTRREIREAGQEVKEAAREVGRDVQRGAREAGDELGREARESGTEVRQTIDRINRNELGWFQRGAGFGGISLGFGPGDSGGSYLFFNPRLGYFVQRGLALGLKFGFENRINTSYRASLFGPFVRYYPIRNRFSLFAEGGLNFGRYRSSLVGPDDKRGFSSINLGLGFSYQLLPALGLELMYDHNYYDKTPEFAGRNRGPQIKLGLNFHLSSRSSRYGYNY
ncbi:outer membrane beta-barrel protein [Tellurirhabdus rosea]|uniref:outer membrane beta-barrel protein n=1 Tax=Tellurirhabdus rosea TaxID=2674997 RepID=UPI00225237B1|nr:outer membrane beta-barrel protein [Tellurirhabdus rosea]